MNRLLGKHPFYDSLGNAYPDTPASYLPNLPDGAPNPSYRPDMPYVPKNQDLQTSNKYSAAMDELVEIRTPESVKSAVARAGCEVASPANTGEVAHETSDRLLEREKPTLDDVEG